MGAPAELLLLPGPTPVPVEVREACASQVVLHRGEAFREVQVEVVERLKSLFGAEGRVAVLPSSGTGALEAAIVNACSPGDRVLACVMGEFGERFGAAAEAYGLDVDRIEVPWGQVPAPDAVLDRLAAGCHRAVLLTHSETSTGALLPLESLVPAIRRAAPRALVLVDAVSSFAAVPFAMDAWGVDVAVTASQKALMTPPGLGIVALGDRGLEALGSARLPRFTWNLRPYVSEPPELPYTPAVTLWFGLRAALRRIAREGAEEVYRRHRLLARMVRAGARALGLRPLAADGVSSPTVTALLSPEGVDPAAVIRGLGARGVVVAPGQGPLRGRAFRIGHMGAVVPDDILRGLAALEDVLTELGLPARGACRAAEREREEVAAGWIHGPRW